MTFSYKPYPMMDTSKPDTMSMAPRVFMFGVYGTTPLLKRLPDNYSRFSIEPVIYSIKSVIGWSIAYPFSNHKKIGTAYNYPTLQNFYGDVHDTNIVLYSHNRQSNGSRYNIKYNQ